MTTMRETENDEGKRRCETKKKRKRQRVLELENQSTHVATRERSDRS